MKKAFAAISLLLAGCATAPTGPAVMVLPGSGKSFDQFRFDDHECRQYASSQVGGASANQAATDSGVKSAVVGTAVGAAAGGLIGGNAGAGVGAGIGLVGGALAGTDAANASGHTLQQRYDIGYQQCMYAKGHKIPMSRGYAARTPTRYTSAPPPPPPGSPPPAPSASAPPPPPPGTPPPPPPGYRVN
jgi:hypothetical protein